MEVFFVRHGQTDGNIAKRHQHPNTAINQVGVFQAQAVAKKVGRLKPTHLITSPSLRAVLTAQEIAKVCDLIPVTQSLFKEFIRPSYLVGERLISNRTLLYIWQWFWGYPEASRHSGETYAQFIKRIEDAKNYLEKLPTGARVVVVSHTVFINLFLEHLDNPKPMGLFRAGLRFFKIFRLKNASLIQLHYDDAGNSDISNWQLIKKF